MPNRTKRFLCLLFAAALLLPLFGACQKADNTREKYIEQLKNTLVLQVGDETVTAMEYNYNYFSNVAYFTNAYSDYLSYFGLDPTQPLRDQVQDADTGATWADYFMEATTTQMQQVLLLCIEAQKKGMTLSELSQSSIEAYLLEAQEQAQDQGITVDELLQSYYGPGLTESDYVRFLERRFLASDYLDWYLSELEYPEEEYEAYYAEHKDDLDAVDMRFYFLQPEDLDKDASDEEHEAALAECKTTAEKFLAEVTDEASFREAALQYAAEEDKELFSSDSATLFCGQYKKDIDDKYAQWLFDPARKEGDEVLFDTEDGCAIFYFVSRYRPEHGLASMRHILLEVTEETAEDGTVTSDDEEVKARAEALLAEWKSGDATEESFSALVEGNSDDPGSVNNGGLYEDFDKGEMVSDIESWIWAENRQAGDCEIVRSPYGYHLVYFLGYSEPRWRSTAFDAMQEEDYNELLDALSASYTVDVNKDAYSLIDAEDTSSDSEQK